MTKRLREVEFEIQKALYAIKKHRDSVYWPKSVISPSSPYISMYMEAVKSNDPEKLEDAKRLHFNYCLKIEAENNSAIEEFRRSRLDPLVSEKRKILDERNSISRARSKAKRMMRSFLAAGRDVSMQWDGPREIA